MSFSVRPAHVDPAVPSSRAYFTHDVDPGGSFTDGVAVANGGATTVTLFVYGVDGLTGQTSGAVYANRGVARHGAGGWVTPTVSRITVAPGHAVTVSFSVRVPGGAVPGDHLAGIAFENAAPTVSGGRFRIRQIVREVVGVLVRVPGPALPRLRLGHIGLQTLTGTGLAALLIDIGNAGRALCKPAIRVAIAGGGVRRRIARKLDTVLPRDTISYPLILQRGLKPATYAVDARAACGASVATAHVEVAVRASLRGAADPGRGAGPVLGPRNSGFPTWGIIGVALAAAVGGAFLGSRLRLRRLLA